MKKTLKIVLLISLVLFCLSFIFFLNRVLSDELLSKRLIKIYSEDQNYVTLVGEIIIIEENKVEIKCEGLKEYIPYQSEYCSYHIYSNTALNLAIGDIVNFTTVPHHYYDGHDLPIVELCKQNIILLQFDEGKKNLLECVNKHIFY